METELIKKLIKSSVIAVRFLPLFMLFLFSASCFSSLGGLAEDQTGNASSAPSIELTPDRDSSEGELSLTIKIIPPVDKSHVKKYILHWGDNPSDRGDIIHEFSNDDAPFEFSLPDNTKIPQGAGYFTVVSVSDDSIISPAASAPIIDLDMLPPSITFSADSDRDEDHICGVLTITEPAEEDSISLYRIYWETAQAPSLT